MSYRLTEGLSLCSAVALGMAISTGYPAGIVVAVGMPIACLTPASRKLAFRNTIGYYLAGLWPMVSGAGRFTGSVPIAILFWAGTATLLSAPWALAWTPKRGLHCLWRVILAGIAGIAPPLGLIGFISPLTGAGYLFTGGQALLDTLNGFHELAQTTEERNIVVWVNEYFGRVEAEGKKFSEMSAYRENSDKVCASVSRTNGKQSAIRQIFGLTVGIPREPPKMTPVRCPAVAAEFLRQPPRRSSRGSWHGCFTSLQPFVRFAPNYTRGAATRLSAQL